MAALAGRTAVITGINGLLGPVWAESLLDAGAHVIGLDLAVDAPNEAVSKLLEAHADAFTLEPGNVCDRASLEAVASASTVDILVNNAGIDQPPRPGQGYRVEEFPFDEFRKVLDVNLAGAFLCAQVFGVGMVERAKGTIINVGSLYASVSPDETFYDHMPMDPPFLKPPAYGASKAGLLNLTRYLAAHWGPKGVRVNALSPGGVLGKQDEQFKGKFNARVPLKRMATYDDLKAPLRFLASDESAYITGQNLQVDGGFTVW